MSFHDIQEFADRIARPPYNWNAYVAIEAPEGRSPSAHEIVEDLTAALAEFEAVVSALEAQQLPAAE